LNETRHERRAEQHQSSERMPHGFYTVEQWRRPKRGAEPQWVPVQHLNGDHSLSDAIRLLEDLGKPGFYRVVQTQRMIWIEQTDGKLLLRKWHALSPESLARSAEAFDRDHGKWPNGPARRKRSQGPKPD
jgi:hypothetical protein